MANHWWSSWFSDHLLWHVVFLYATTFAILKAHFYQSWCINNLHLRCLDLIDHITMYNLFITLIILLIVIFLHVFIIIRTRHLNILLLSLLLHNFIISSLFFPIPCILSLIFILLLSLEVSNKLWSFRWYLLIQELWKQFFCSFDRLVSLLL